MVVILSIFSSWGAKLSPTSLPFMVSHSYIGVASTLSRLFSTHPQYSSWNGMIMTPRLFCTYPCFPASIMAMFRVEYRFWEVDILAPRLFHIHPCLVASLMVIIKVDHSFLEIVILTPRLFYNHLNLLASFREEVVLIPCLLSSVMAM